MSSMYPMCFQGKNLPTYLLTRKYIWKCCLQNDSHFVLALLCWLVTCVVSIDNSVLVLCGISGQMLMLTTPDAPQITVGNLRYHGAKVQGILTGYYKMAGDHVCNLCSSGFSVKQSQLWHGFLCIKSTVIHLICVVFVSAVLYAISSSLVQVMAWHWPCDMPFPEPIMTLFTDTHVSQVNIFAWNLL